MTSEKHIVITGGVGVAGTCLAAFDDALFAAGIADLNLITLSSVIPPGSVVTIPDPTTTEHRAGQDGDRADGYRQGWDLMGAEWGDRLYCVLAEARVDKPGQEAWAGLAWWQTGDGRGLFVEHHGHSEQQVTDELTVSILECVERRGLRLDDGTWGMAIEGAECIDRPVCALVVATYETQTWCRPEAGFGPADTAGLVPFGG